MGRILSSAAQAVGGTPLIRLRNLEQRDGLAARLLVKPEGLNPGGSAKDRAALGMILDAEARGLLQPGSRIVEPTSGNTGIGLAAIAAARGYRCTIFMPDTMSRERQLLMAAYGAEVVLTPGAEGMSGAIARAEALARREPGCWIAGQFVNPANPRAHYETTGPEIWEDTDGAVDIFVAGIGTGGTITGTGRYLKEQNSAVKIIGVEPEASPLLTQGQAGPHGLQGIGANFVPEILDRTLLDGVIPVAQAEAEAAARRLGREEGILCGFSGGAALWAGLRLARQPENRGKTIVVLLPDSGERYLSTGLYGG